MLLFKNVNLLVLIGGIVIGLSVGSLFNGCGDRIPSFPSVKPAAIVKVAAKNAVVYQKQLDSLHTTCSTLATQLQSTKTQLDQAKKKNLVLQTRVYDLIDRQGAVPVTDTATMVADCDTLKMKVAELITSSNEKDSLYETDVSNLEAQLHNKDSTIDTQTAMYQSLQSSFTQATNELQTQASENKVLKKQIRRQRFKNTLRTIGIAVLTGLGAHYLTNH